jgi:predicted phosphodiesterase
MRLAVFSDIHGNWQAFQTMLDDLHAQEAHASFDAIWCLGDLAAFGAQPAECVAHIRQMQEDYGDNVFKCIGGNTDRYLTMGVRMPSPPAKDEAGLQRRITAFQERDAILNWNLAQFSWDDYAYLAKINSREVYKQVEGYGTILGVHAIPGDDEGIQLRPDSPDEEATDALLDREGRLVLVGHTHYQMDRQVGGWRVINPGSVGLSFGQAGYAEWAILTFDGADVQVDLRAVPYDVDATISALEASQHPNTNWVIQRLRPTT